MSAPFASAPPPNYQLLSSAEASNDAAIDFTFDGNDAFTAYRFIGANIRPETDGTKIACRTSTDGGSNFDNGSSDYGWFSISGDTGGSILTGNNQSSDTEIQMIQNLGIGNANDENANFILDLFKPSGTNYTLLTGRTICIGSGSAVLMTNFVGARWSGADVDALRFFMLSGNITSGEIALYGAKK